MLALFVSGPLHGQMRQVTSYAPFPVAGAGEYNPRFLAIHDAGSYRKLCVWLFNDDSASELRMIDAMGIALGISTEDTR
jgi:hypothetical protein